MKVGILTYFSAHNYGAFLQAYALQKALSEYSGVDAELINYRSPKEIEFYKAPTKLSHVNVLNAERKIRVAKFYKRRFLAFEKAIQEYQVTSEDEIITMSTEEFNQFIEGKYDLIVVGSDEIWKTDNFRGFPNVYWLPNTKCKKVSYAASARNNYKDLDETTIAQIERFVKEFEYIGVRDSATKDLVEKFEGLQNKCFLNCDPTFLYDFHPNPSNGKKILREKFRVAPDKKVIGLMLEDESLGIDIIKTYSSKFEFISLYHYCANSKMYPELNPFEWIDVISAVDGMITTFFHATIFSIKCNTRFLAVDNRSDDVYESKMYDLLSRNGLADDYFVMYNREKRDELVLRRVGAFLADIQDPSIFCDFSNVCENERNRANSFFSMLGLKKKSSVDNVDARDCCSCGLCANICPKTAISMVLDEEGFYRPKVNSGKCVKCGLCVEFCINNRNWSGLRTWGNAPKAYGFRHSDETIRLNSRSGGFFTVISDYVLKNQGVVYGSAFSQGMNVNHIRATSPEERDLMRGSKYVQSPSFHLFSQVKKDLEEGRWVLYSGLPCQVTAIKKYLEKTDCEKLILLDLLCHGVPSIRVWKDYIDLCAASHNGKVEKFEFRNKIKFGWHSHVESYWIDGKEFDSGIYTDLFYDHNILNKGCSYCHFKSTERVSDLTLGDFWGVEKAIPEYDDNRGVSLVLVNTPKGERLFTELTKADLFCREVPLEKCLQNSMKKSYPMPEERTLFWQEYNKFGLSGVLERKKHKEKRDRMKHLPSRIMAKGKRFLRKVLLKGV